MDKLMYFAKGLLSKQTYNNLKKIKSKEDKFNALCYSLISFLEDRNHILQKKMKEFKSKKVNTLYAHNYVTILPSKISYLKAQFSEDGLLRAIDLLSKAEKEVNAINV